MCQCTGISAVVPSQTPWPPRSSGTQALWWFPSVQRLQTYTIASLRLIFEDNGTKEVYYYYYYTDCCWILLYDSLCNQGTVTFQDKNVRPVGVFQTFLLKTTQIYLHWKNYSDWLHQVSLHQPWEHRKYPPQFEDGYTTVGNPNIMICQTDDPFAS